MDCWTVEYRPFAPCYRVFFEPHFNNKDTWVLAGFTGVPILASSVRDRMKASRSTVLEIPEYRDTAITESLRLPPGARWYLHTMETCKTELQERFASSTDPRDI